MATTNPVFQILTTSGNQAPLAAGNRIDQLHNGQIGIFNPHTGLSVDGSVLGDCADIFLAVGINRTSGGTNFMEDYQRSAGQVIPRRHMRSYVVKGTMPEVSKVVEVGNFKAFCETEYQIKIEYRNAKNYYINGYNQMTKTFKYFSSDCADPCLEGGCGPGDQAEVAGGLVADINSDPDKAVLASMFTYRIQATAGAASSSGNLTITIGSETFTVAVLNTDTAILVAGKIVAAINAVSTSAYKAFTPGTAVFQVYPKTGVSAATATIALTNAGATGVTLGTITAANLDVADATAWRVSNPGIGLSIRITGVAETRPSFANDINIQYHKTGLDFIVTPIAGFESNNTTTVITPLSYKEGSGYDLKQLEYEAGGFNGKPGPYRQSDSTGLARGGFEYFIAPASSYNVLSLAYDQESVGGWLEYKNNLETLVAIPCADATTLTGLIAMLDLIFTQFAPMANDVASMTCSNTRMGLLTAATDGIESIA
jgi:hypothetical protein